MSVQVHLEKFEGPLDLLLHLIRQQEMNIFDIPIHEITSKYLEYIRAMQALDLDMAGEFITMAATLIQIKARMLFPEEKVDESEESEDPRRELVEQLLAYQRYKMVAKKLDSQDRLGRECWSGFSKGLDELEKPGEITKTNGVYSLIVMYKKIVTASKRTTYRVKEELQTVMECVQSMTNLFKVGETINWRALIRQRDTRAKVSRGSVAVTFLSLLELAKQGFVSLMQSQNFEDIYLKTHKPVEQLHSFDNYESNTEDHEFVPSNNISEPENVL